MKNNVEFGCDVTNSKMISQIYKTSFSFHSTGFRIRDQCTGWLSRADVHLSSGEYTRHLLHSVSTLVYTKQPREPHRPGGYGFESQQGQTFQSGYDFCILIHSGLTGSFIFFCPPTSSYWSYIFLMFM